MYLLQSTPTLNVDDTHAPRRSALGYIMENKLEKALKQESQTDDDLTLIELYPFLPGGENQQLDMDALDKKFKQYVDDQCKKLAN